MKTGPVSRFWGGGLKKMLNLLLRSTTNLTI